MKFYKEPDRNAAENHNLCREERRRRKNAYQKLSKEDRNNIRKCMLRCSQQLDITEVQAFDLLGAIGEFLARKRVT